MRNFYFLVGTLFILSCSKAPERAQVVTNDPAAVDSGKVKTIVQVTNQDMLNDCLQSIQASGANILYSNDVGMILTDGLATSLDLNKCEAEVVSNEAVEVKKPISNASKQLNPTDNQGPIAPLKISKLLELLPAEEIGARSFIKNNETYDGRGVVIGVIDTGIELDHPMLSQTTTGAPKIVAFSDTSGEGKVETAPVTIDEEGTFTSKNGVNYQAKGLPTEGALFGLFKGSTLNQGTDAAEGDKFVDVGILVTKAEDGTLVARIDTNANLDFTDESALTNFKDGAPFTKLGEKKTLTTAVNILEEGKVLNLAFDDGSHGTHVGGIAAGYVKDGLIGVAPGAQIVVAKIGDARLAGGSTTLASKMLGIDYVVSKGAEIVNISYGIRAGSNNGQSAIDQYIDKVAKEKDVVFTISAGNEGPELLSVGTPAGAELALTVGAYVSKETAQNNYGYVGFNRNQVWWFSSVGPMLGGGLKPSILAPGAALSALPQFTAGYQTYRGTSMAAPEAAGGVALLLSAAKQAGLATDRASIVQAIMHSAENVDTLTLVEQGHGLINVNNALDYLTQHKGEAVIEYSVSVSSITTPDNTGGGIYVRSGNLTENAFRVDITPTLPKSLAEQGPFLRAYRLEPSAEWIKAPKLTWLANGTRGFWASVDASVLETPGLHSEKISVIDDSTGNLAFVIPVTVISPIAMNAGNKYQHVFETEIEVGESQRFFFDVPAGTTSVNLEIDSDGPYIYGQIVDPEGRDVLVVRDSSISLPQPLIQGQASVKRAGTFELDLISRGFNPRDAKVRVKITLASIKIERGSILGGLEQEFVIENNFEPVQVIPKLSVTHLQKVETVGIEGHLTLVPFSWTEADAKKYSSLNFGIKTAKRYYDLMTDYPYRVFCEDGKVIDAGGFGLISEINLVDACKGNNTIEIQGAFTKEAPKQWGFELTTKKVLKDSISILEGRRTKLETGQFTYLTADFTKAKDLDTEGLKRCSTLTLELVGGDTLQEATFCD